MPRYSIREYYELERSTDYRNDYFDGVIVAADCSTAQHSLISTNIGCEVGNRLKGKPCHAYGPDLRLAAPGNLRVYPDGAVYCGKVRVSEEESVGETATNPTILFEVLSKSTEGYDRGVKSESYRRIETLAAYVLVSQDAPHVEIYERQGGGDWRLREFNELAAVIALPAIDVELPLVEVYDGVEFPPSPSVAPGGNGAE